MPSPLLVSTVAVVLLVLVLMPVPNAIIAVALAGWMQPGATHSEYWCTTLGQLEQRPWVSIKRCVSMSTVHESESMPSPSYTHQHSAGGVRYC